MADTPDNDPAFDPLNAGGGAVDDLTPPSRQFDAAGAFDKANTSGKSESSAPKSNPPSDPGSEVTIRGSSPVRPGRPTEIIPRQVARLPQQGPLAAAGAGVGGPDDFVIQDLSKEALLRNTQRVMFRGQQCPSLNGIPLVSKLGQGGMGAVYCGIHPRLQNRVAVKVLPLQMAAEDTGLVQRLIREAQIAAMIQSPHLAAVYDVNEEDGQFFIVMEFVPGLTIGQYLRQLARQGRPGMAELDAIDVCIAASIGLDAAHQESVIHRDLKPENIMVPFKSRQQNYLELKKAKLMDLGLARSEKGSQSLTGMKVAMGTPGYMSPEQIMNAKSASKPSDVYGMGATLYAMLTGRPPFKESDDDDMMRLLFATVNEPLIAVSKKRGDVSAAVDNLVSTCLEKKPEDRFPDAQELVRALIGCRRILAPSSGFDAFENNATRLLATAAETGLHPHGHTGLPVTPGARTQRHKSRKAVSHGKKWLYAGLGVAGAAMLAGSAVGYAYYSHKQGADDNPETINVHRIYYGDEFRTALHNGDMEIARRKYNAAVKHTSLYPGIKELETADKNAAVFMQIASDLRNASTLDDVKQLRELLDKIVPGSKDDENEKKFYGDKLQKIDDELNIRIDQDISRNPIAPAQKRLAALTDWLKRDPGNKDAEAWKPAIAKAAQVEKAAALIEQARKDDASGHFDDALQNVQEAVRLDKNLASSGQVLAARIQNAIKRETQRAELEIAVRKLSDTYGKALGLIVSEDFPAADAAAAEADQLLAEAKKIDSELKPAVQVAFLHQRIADARKAAEYRNDLLAARKLLDEGNADAAEAKLGRAKQNKPLDESGLEAADLQDQIARAQYARALERAVAQKNGPNFDAALAQAEIAILKKPADEKGNRASDIKREILQAQDAARDRALHAETLAAARKLKLEGKYKEALAKIDESREKYGIEKDAASLESEIVKLQRDALVAAEARRIADEKKRLENEKKAKDDQLLAQRLAAAKDSALAAIETGNVLLAGRNYDAAIKAYEEGKAVAKSFSLPEAEKLEDLTAAARRKKEDNSAEGKRKLAVTTLLAEISGDAENDLERKIKLLDAKMQELKGDQRLAARRDELAALQRAVIQKQKVEEQRRLAEAQRQQEIQKKQLFEGAVAAFAAGDYDDAAQKLKSQGFTAAAAAFGEIKGLIEESMDDIDSYKRAYKIYSEKVRGREAEFNAAVDNYLKLNSFAAEKLRNAGVDEVLSVVKAVRTEKAALCAALDAKNESIKAAFSKALSDELVSRPVRVEPVTGTYSGGNSSSGKQRGGETKE